MTRATVLLVAGDWRGAFRLNPFVGVLAIAVIWTAANSVYALTTGRHRPDTRDVDVHDRSGQREIDARHL